ncbi:zinc-binding dehydrogenase [Nocardioides sp. Bht2]|uniref:zinc-binding dehydrogenase n=1 Tax=Nocardioides sp. Bht2 TaxID=3392297 RepID=UPI0039B3EF8F
MENRQMLAAQVAAPDPDHPDRALAVGPCPTPADRPGHTRVALRASALNMHDVWMLRGLAPSPSSGPRVLGSDGAGLTDDGREVIVYPVALGAGPEHVTPLGTLLSDLGAGLLAEEAVVRSEHLVTKPAHLSWAEAAALPTSWLTAYRMLFTQGRLDAGSTLLVQGAGGGVATAALALGRAVGATVMVTSRSAEKRERALALGADHVVATGERLPALADVVIDAVGPATFEHSIAATAVGGRVVTCGSATGFVAPLNLARLFAREITVHGSTMGTFEEFTALVGLVDRYRLRPEVDSTLPLERLDEQVRRMVEGDAFGKLCVALG